MREYGFSLTVFSRIKTESQTLSLQGRIRVSENSSYRTFYAVFYILHVFTRNPPFNTIFSSGDLHQPLSVEDLYYTFYKLRIL